MPFSVSSRALALFAAALLLASAASYYVSTEFSPTASGCSGYDPEVRIMSFNNRTYCGDMVSVTGPWMLVNNTTDAWAEPTANVTLFGYAFELAPLQEGEVGGILVSITEPGGAQYHGWLRFGGPVGATISSWFTTDNESGVWEPGFNADVTLLVEAGA